MEKSKIIVVVGPTASGKTALSIALAKKFGGEVVSADSRQIYQELDIGTEKISPAEMDGVPHHLLDIVSIDDKYSAKDFKHDATQAIADILSRGKVPIIAGGTFFYVDTLLGRINPPEVEPDYQLRAHLEDMSAETLHKSLEKLDPERAFNIDKHNKRRLVRALEIIHNLGKVPTSKPAECPYEVILIGIKTERKALRTRIRDRVAGAIERGLIAETETLLAAGASKDRLAEIGLEYGATIEFIDGKINEEELLKKLEEKNWQYAKRQLNWLKRDETIEWYERENSEAIFTHVQQFLS